ncbi:MAG: E3 binding domain-containing protein, partial [Solirubrobacteraceae bacterium]|nr:E3 binding domain-containing protein [Solirubrobacteraceae bacterium]
MTEIVMPRLSDSMEEGTIIRWLRSDGEQIARGDELVEIETDKATMTYEADAEGLVHIVAREGDTLPVGTLIAHLLLPGEATPTVGGAEEPAHAPGTGSDDRDGSATPSSAGPPPVVVSSDGPPATRDRVKASPLARRLARELGVELAGLAGSGPGGRIVKADVQSAASGALTAPTPAAAAAVAPTPAQAPTAPAPAKTPPPTPPAAPALDAGTAKGHVTITEPTRTQQLIARRMAESRATIPAFTLRTSVDMT